MMSERACDTIAAMLKRKAEWHRAQAHRSLKDKVRILLMLQRQELPLLSRQRSVRPWERPWAIEP